MIGERLMKGVIAVSATVFSFRALRQKKIELTPTKQLRLQPLGRSPIKSLTLAFQASSISTTLRAGQDAVKLGSRTGLTVIGTCWCVDGGRMEISKLVISIV